MYASIFVNRFIYLLLIIGILTGLTGCDSDKNTATRTVSKQSITQNTQQNHPAFEWLTLIGGYTQGTIARKAPIRIVFNHEIIDDTRLGKAAEQVIQVSPPIKGQAVFKTKSEIVWTPAEHFQSGVEYTATLQAADLKGIPSDITPFQFSFRVIPLEFEIKTEGLTTLTGADNQLLLKGQLLVSDQVDSDAVESVLKVTQQGQLLPVEWSHDRHGKQHRFVISQIMRETFATDVELNWNGQPIDIKTQGQRVIHVPKVNEFKMMSMRVIHESGVNPFVQIRFSSELESQQNLKGLVQLAKHSYTLRMDGNVINIYPKKNLSGTVKVTLSQGIKARGNQTLKQAIEQSVMFDALKPQVKFVGKGTILPTNAVLEIPFEAVGVNAVEVTAFEIYPDNMGSFLQVNRLSGNHQIGRSGRYLWRKTIPLTPANPNQWNRFSFNVTDLMKKHRAGLLRLTLSIKRQHSTYHCSTPRPSAKSKQKPLNNWEDNGLQEASGWDGISDYFEDAENYNQGWRNRHDPCSDAYYIHKPAKTQVSHNFMTSNIGLIAKQDSQGYLRVITTNIRTTEPLAKVALEVKNYQGRSLMTAVSDASGFAQIALPAKPFLLIARKGEETTYLKLNAKTALAISHFDVGGKKVKKGIKGMIYGERGVWRPGDDIHLTLVVQNKQENIPAGHPVTMKLINPQGRVVQSKTSTDSVGGFYSFQFKTAEKAPTGRWMAKAFFGGSKFSRSLMVETVRPNRLRVELSFDDTSIAESVLYSSEAGSSLTLFSQWLHGATARQLKADVSVRFSRKTTRFETFADYEFDDPTRQLNSQNTLLAEGRLDDQGYLKFKKALKPEGLASGLLTARFSARVFEEGGAFSISRNQVDYHPYEHYVGIKFPKGDLTRGILLTDQTHTVNIASVNAQGKPVSLPQVQVSLYKIQWKWWWDKAPESLADYAASQHTGLLQQSIISTLKGQGRWTFEIKYPQWGRYLIRACDLKGKHCTAKTVYIDWPGWAGRAQEEGSGAASRLNLFSDKAAYSVGETAHIQLPSASQGRALLTVETGSHILEQRWIVLTGENKVQVQIPITAKMSPNAYVHITLLQPHEGKDNDRPIRLYGIIPLQVTDPETYLKPLITVAEEWKPESTQTITVTEAQGKAMNYTLAVVDEGLLGLTSFKTPNLHTHFYSKEALGIQTWDIFDEVVGAYGGKLERMLALGGGDAAKGSDEENKKRRFPPVVRVLGPFHLDQGQTAKHAIKLPPYLGAVRVMLVAGEKSAYGRAEASVFIRQPLMLQASLPRVLGPNESVRVPVTLFAMNDSVKQVTVQVKTDDLVSVTGESKIQVSFDQTGEKLAFIQLKTASKEGKTYLHFSAIAGEKGEFKAEADIYLDIRRANPASTRSVSQIIEPGTSWDYKPEAFGLEGTNEARLELSSVPSLNLGTRLDYLIRYPHGCLEQTTSSAFPQLYLAPVMALSPLKQKKIEHHIQKAIERLQRFQTGTGDFSYWPGSSTRNEWASIYAGHFLIEADKQGYSLPSDLLSPWLNQQIDQAQRRIAGSQAYSHTQAYRLYVLAIAGKPQMGAMNRLRESKQLNKKARWLLASAYQRAAQPEAAQLLVEGLLPEVNTVSKPDQTFSSTLGDLGLQLENLVVLKKQQGVQQLLEKISEALNGNQFQSTQGISWALMAVSHYLKGNTEPWTAQLTQGEPDQATKIPISSDKTLATTQLISVEAPIRVDNTSDNPLFATLITQGVAKAGHEQNLQQGLSLQVLYEIRDIENSELWYNTNAQFVVQGSDLRISVTVKNTRSYTGENIALTMPVAAGMEIFSATEQPEIKGQYDYRDLRDDRIHYYFSLKAGESKTFKLLANAAYQGHYYLPAIRAEAMYDGALHAHQKGQWVDIKQHSQKP